MKKFIMPILVAIVIIMGAYIIFDKYQKNDNENNSQKSTEKQSEDLFAKKKECAGYKDKIMEDILTPNLIYNNSDPVLIEIFYSPKRESCLYVFEYYKSPDCLKMNAGTYIKAGCQFKESEIIDFLTKETVYSTVTYKNCLERLTEKEGVDISICKTVSERVEELKN